MEEKKYLNEEEYQKKNKKVKKVARILLIAGVIISFLGIICLILFIMSAANFSGNRNPVSPSIMFLLMILAGLFLLIGGLMTIIGAIQFFSVRKE